ncbi:MAG: UDP-N-acetylmuramoyl-tripeptide--D-alanyl-D-alanine ligase [Gemmatimonadaceae bacterium]|nr:UDP-N-acetylmuramoyl-tripeptide--D-alanyl-D-alanine ligase [Gemmatimonadaceae bacterium]
MTPFMTSGTEFEAVPAVTPALPHPFWTFERVAQALGTGPSMPNPLGGVSTDTRSIAAGDVFVALQGDTFDAHDFLDTAKAAGAAAFVVSDAARAAGLGIPTYVVPDTLVALGELAHAWRKAWGRSVIAVAGSNGKTSTKELLRAALSRTYVVHATKGNLNNRVGVPLTLLSMPSDAELAVIELGTNLPGEVGMLRAIAAPDVAVLTSIGEEHLEGLGDLAGVLREEADVFHGVTLAVVAASAADAVSLARTRAQSVITAGLTDADALPDEWSLDAQGSVQLTYRGVPVNTPLRGAHQAANTMLALAVAEACGVPLEDAAAGLAEMTVPNMRGVWETLGSATLINDAYNANPASMRAALQLLSDIPGDRQRVAILGSMRELGPQSDAQHDEVARAALASRAALIAGVGDMAAALARVAPDDTRVVRAESANAESLDDMWSALMPRLDKTALILLKASRGVRLERLVPQLAAWATLQS